MQFATRYFVRCFDKFLSFSKTCAYNYEQIRPHNGTVNTLQWLYLACVWYVLDTCWKHEVLVVSSNENAKLRLRHVNLLHAVNILAFRKRLLAKFASLDRSCSHSLIFTRILRVCKRNFEPCT